MNKVLVFPPLLFRRRRKRRNLRKLDREGREADIYRDGKREYATLVCRSFAKT
jgi:hypothetical protein